MILHENKTFLAYRCPHCGTGVIGLCGTFALGGGRLFRLRCACGESNMSVCETSDHKIRLSVPCLLCRTDHHYVLSPSLFFGKELFLLNCTYSDLDICFSGTEEIQPPRSPTPRSWTSCVFWYATWRRKGGSTAPVTTATMKSLYPKKGFPSGVGTVAQGSSSPSTAFPPHRPSFPVTASRCRTPIIHTP